MRFASEVRADRHLLPILFRKPGLPSESHWETRCGTALHPNVTDPVSIWPDSGVWILLRRFDQLENQKA
jgi:hypothetical protein